MSKDKKVDLVCHYCREPFRRFPSNVRVGKRVFCKKACYDASRPVFHRRESVLEFLVEYALAHGGQSPTYREIGKEVGISSSSVVKYILEDLAEGGLIVLPEKYKVRAIGVVGMKMVWQDPRLVDNG